MKKRSARARQARPQQARVFVGCEGASERGYASLLRSFLKEHGLPIHLDATVLNPGAGDPLELVKRAVAEAERSAERRGVHVGRFLLLDSDRHAPDSDLGRRTVALARQHGIILVWQAPCHEALLLRHLPGCLDRRPIATAEAGAALKRLWPDYAKGKSCQQLALRIDEAAVLRVAEVEPDLHGLLVAVGLIAGPKTGKGRKT